MGTGSGRTRPTRGRDLGAYNADFSEYRSWPVGHVAVSRLQVNAWAYLRRWKAATLGRHTTVSLSDFQLLRRRLSAALFGPSCSRLTSRRTRWKPSVSLNRLPSKM